MVRLLGAPLQTISTLRADIVPKREMAIRKWYFASPLWHYHQRGLPGDFVQRQSNYALIDSDLRPLCRLLHSAGISTTPSCQGHFHDRDHFQAVWNELQIECEQIQTSGLVVRDTTTQREFLFRASTFQLPWRFFEDFYRHAAAAQSDGFLGMLVPREQSGLICRLHNQAIRTPRAYIRFDGDLSCILGGSLFAAVVRAADPDDCSAQWQRIYENLSILLKFSDTDDRPFAKRGTSLASPVKP